MQPRVTVPPRAVQSELPAARRPLIRSWFQKRRSPIPLEDRDRAPELCSRYLLLKYRDQLPLVARFIVEIEERARDHDGPRWEAFINRGSLTDEMLKPLDLEFERWLQSRQNRQSCVGRESRGVAAIR